MVPFRLRDSKVCRRGLDKGNSPKDRWEGLVDRRRYPLNVSRDSQETWSTPVPVVPSHLPLLFARGTGSPWVPDQELFSEGFLPQNVVGLTVIFISGSWVRKRGSYT